MTFEKLSELTTFLQRGISPKYEEFGIPVINQKCIRNGQLKRERVKFHSKQKNISPEKYLLENDILVNSTGVGTLGRVARVGETRGEVVADSHVTIVRPNLELVDPVFLFYALRLSEPTIVSMASGSTGQTELSRFALGELEIPKLEKSAQKFIASTFASIDAKISVNEALAQTLENIAQALFRSWFIDFDPVKAKMAGETLVGMDAETAELFPDSMEDSGLGEIPSGWGVVEAGEIAFTTIGGLWGADDSEEGRSSSYYCLRGTDLDDLKSTGLAERTPVRWDKAESIGKRQSSNNHVLIGGSGAGPVGKSLLWDSSIDALFDSPVIYSNFVKRFETSTQAEATFLYFLLQDMLSSGEIFEHVGGTSVPNLLDKTLLESKRFAMPPEPLLKVFDALYRAALQIRYSGESKYLAQLRDALLPRLISGELEIPDEMVAA